jgi:hypothetical protein
MWRMVTDVAVFQQVDVARRVNGDSCVESVVLYQELKKIEDLV